MMNSIHHTLPYGAGNLHIDAAAGEFAGCLVPRTPPPGLPSEILQNALAHPTASPLLRDLVRGKQSAAILVPGKMRIAAAKEYVHALLGELHAGGLKDNQIEIFLATGTHENHGHNDLLELLGKETMARIRCRTHDASDPAQLIELGKTSRGTPVLINRHMMDRQVKILTGRIVPHYFAGYGGGRKALIPGVAGLETILANHSLTLAPDSGIASRVGPCSLPGNPVHLDMLEGARLVEPDFCLNTILDAKHRLIDVVAGNFEQAHLEGCQRVRTWFQLRLPQPVDFLITCAGGLPYDTDFIQALKAAFDVQEAVRPGGCLLWVAECREGMPGAFDRWAAVSPHDSLESAVRSGYNLAGHNTVMLRQLTSKLQVALLSSLSAERVRALGLHAVSSIEEGWHWAKQRLPANFRYATVPYANICHVVAGTEAGNCVSDRDDGQEDLQT